ncbi:hypothetical protein [Polyangium fumosum]|uniref:Uncharacterized protein n=1 Tax=Polyangium fumosum TaxID=889272 RepID=A0A4U1J8J9_9BACT|nr:hypothetical protein [Polyangium fumosum]TKD03965.1 hypothetical protein E8A74_24230 [Polyangium fumosum]
MGTKKRGGGRVAIAASIAFVCACGARSEIETMGPAPAASTTSSCHNNGDAGEGGEAQVPGCVLLASHINGADLDPTTLTMPESSPPGPHPVVGYWDVVDNSLSIVGHTGKGPWFQLWSNDIDALACGKSLPLVPTMSEAVQNHVFLMWATAGATWWASATGTLHVVAYEPSASTEQRPIHIEIHGASMVPGPTEVGSPTNHASGTFTADLSCRLEEFWNVAFN